MRILQNATRMLNAAAATGTGIVMDIGDFRNFVIGISTSGNANFTLKVQGSIQTLAPDFTSAASPTNMWTYIQSIDLADQSTVAGATGIVATGTDLNRTLEVNVNLLRWVTVTVTAYSAGAITVWGMPASDD
jgi:hypothetical protein